MCKKDNADEISGGVYKSDFFWGVWDSPGIEFRALCLLDRHSTT
jgi:hypothetical protein